MSIINKYPSAQQKQLLLQLIEADPLLRTGKFSSTFTKKQAEEKWRNIADKVNALNGANKSWESWRKTWQDRKSNAKKKYSQIKKHANMTGGGPPPKSATEEDLLVLSTLPSEALDGHTDCHESVVEFDVVQITKTTKDIAAPNLNKGASSSSHSSAEQIEAEAEVASCSYNEVPATVFTSHFNSGESSSRTQRRKAKLTKEQALLKSIQTAENLNRTLEEKNKYKKLFYEQFIELMRKQTDALTAIANAMTSNNV